MSLTYLSGENYSLDLYDKRHENRLYMILCGSMDRFKNEFKDF